MNEPFHSVETDEEFHEETGGAYLVRELEQKVDAYDPSATVGLDGYWGELDIEKMKFSRAPVTVGKKAFDEILVKLAKAGVDDIVIQSEECIATKLGSHFSYVTSHPLTFPEVSTLLAEITRDSVPGKVRGGVDHNFPYSVPVEVETDGVVRVMHIRFRGNAVSVLGGGGRDDGMQLTLRKIDPHPKTMDELGVPDGIRKLIDSDSGIVFVTGETGSGKTTLLGSFIRHIITQPDGVNVATYEDPIEYDFRAVPGKTSVIAQSSIGEMLPSYDDAIPNALRRNPDVIMLGEVRERVAINNALIAAQSGHLIFTTVHTDGVAITFSRMVSVFPAEERQGKIDALIGSTRGIIHQRLLKAKGGKGRVPVQEWLTIGRRERDRLLDTPNDKLTLVLQQMLEDVGHPLLRDLEAKKHLIDEVDYLRVHRALTREQHHE